MKSFAFFVLSCIGICQMFSQNPSDLAVQLSAEIQEGPAQITLQWPSTNALSIKIYRKLDKNNSSFSAPIATLSGSETQYVDNNVVIGREYEYRVEKQYSNYTANGYMLSGIKVLPKDSRGSIVLLVESSMAMPLQQELNTLEKDLMGDGWKVIRHNIPAGDAPPQVKQRIVQDYNAAPNDVKAVLIIGHVAVPYSGLIVPDGHPPEHLGAWPADCYYGDMNGSWTDTSVNNTSALDLRNHNVPGDGKFDQSVLPSDLELQVGRVDFHDLPVFDQNETALLRKYLNKNHSFRNKQFTPTERGLIDDNFGGSINSFSSSLYRSFNVMFGAANVDDKDYFTTLANESYLWSHGNGGGYYDRANGVGNSQDFADIEVKSVFTTLFGSWHGDWDSTNNFMRASLASGSILTCAWSGIPQWQFHQMALGENIGFCAKNTNNAFDYQYTIENRKLVHIALMGDPTLRMHVVAPPAILQISDSGSAELSWAPSNADNLLGYHVYLKRENEIGFQRLTNEVLVNTSYTSPITAPGLHTYMVRAVNLEENPSGSYYNLSQGIFGEIQLGDTGPEPEILIADAGEDKVISCSVQTVELGGANTTTGATYNWSTVDGIFESATDQPKVTVSMGGTYVLTVSKTGSETVTDEVLVTTDFEEPIVDLGDDVTIQVGESVNIGLPELAGHVYSWLPDDSLSDTAISNPIASPTNTTTYTLMVTSPNGCVAQSSITVQVEGTVAESEILIADAGNDQTITCAATTVELGGTNTTIGAAHNWATTDGTFESATDQPMVTVSAAGTYVLTVTKFGSETVTDEVMVIEDTEVPIVELGDTITIQSGESVNIGLEALTGYAYLWSSDDTLSATNVSDPVATPIETTTYTLMVVAPNGCTSEDSVTVQVEEDVVGEREMEDSEDDTIVLYPNPASEIIHIVSDQEVGSIAISDMTDRLILKSASKDIDVSALRSGVYILHFIVNGRLVIRNFIKQ